MVTQLSIIDKIIKKTATSCLVQEDWVEQIIKHGQWKAAKDALENNNSVEIKGLGKFLIREYFLKRKIKQLETILKGYEKKLKNTTPTPILLRRYELTTKELEYIKTKQNEITN